MSRLLFILGILFLLDLYAFKGIVLLMKSNDRIIRYLIYSIYWVISLIIVYKIYDIFAHWDAYRISEPQYVRYWSGIFFVLIFTKLGFISFHVIDDVFWMGRQAVAYFAPPKTQLGGTAMTRGLFLSQLGLGLSGLLFGAFSYGVITGRYNFKILREKIIFKSLPKVFNGLKIVQISDLHLGSFVNDFDEVKRLVPLINDLNPDLILFTGDMVNSHSDEAEPWIPIFSQLKAKYGKYSVFGNHDYCDYGNFTREEKRKSIQRLKEIHGEMGFKLLEDEYEYLKINDDKIALIGTHNWGRGFHQVGNLDKALHGVDNNVFKVLLSHDPTLWEEKVKNRTNIALTLSGHTHGMQMGVEAPSLGIKWSPVQLVYKRWAGLYQEGDNYIYINRGLGFLGFPGRVGISPEITLIELEA